MYLMLYLEEIEKLKSKIEYLNKIIDKLESQIEDQAELIYTLKDTLYKTPLDDPEGEASDYYNY